VVTGLDAKRLPGRWIVCKLRLKRRGGDRMESSGENTGLVTLVQVVIVIAIVALILAYIVDKA
jgi:hypothetical protein